MGANGPQQHLLHEQSMVGEGGEETQAERDREKQNPLKEMHIKKKSGEGAGRRNAFARNRHKTSINSMESHLNKYMLKK